MKPDEKKTEAPMAEEPKPEETLPEDVIDAVSGGLDQEMIDHIQKYNPDVYQNMWLLGHI